MIDPIQLPLLLKAIDFVFDEGRKILEERRERRKMKDVAPKDVPPKDVSPKIEDSEPAKELVVSEPEDGKEIKQDLLTSKVDELLWQNHQLEIQHLVKLLETYSHNYHLAREQYAKWGDALVPPIIVHNMQDAENSMIETINQLEVVLSKVYKREINLIK
jgi:hypothetical protein